jgi:hypothetical protein
MGRSRARIGLDLLLATYAEWDVLSVEWQLGPGLTGPWVLVVLGQPSDGDDEAFVRHHFAIWKTTGNVYGAQDGAVTDDPLLTP